MCVRRGVVGYPTNIVGITRGTPLVATLVVDRDAGRNLGCSKGFHITYTLAMALGMPGLQKPLEQPSDIGWVVEDPDATPHLAWCTYNYGSSCCPFTSGI